MDVSRHQAAIAEAAAILRATFRTSDLVARLGGDELVVLAFATPDRIGVTGFHGQTVAHRPDRGWTWQIGDGAERMLVFLELPPFHACSVRFDMPNTGYDLSGYEAAATRFTADHEGFSAMPPFDQRVGTMRIHAEGRQRVTADRGESLFVIAQQNAANAKTDLRFVHQIGAPPGK